MKWLIRAFPFRDPAFRWGFLHPFGPPPPWWHPDRRKAYFDEHGYPWHRSQSVVSGTNYCADSSLLNWGAAGAPDHKAEQ